MVTVNKFNWYTFFQFFHDSSPSESENEESEEVKPKVKEEKKKVCFLTFFKKFFLIKINENFNWITILYLLDYFLC